MNRQGLKITALLAVLVGVALLLVWGIPAARREQAQEAERDRPLAIPPRVSVQGGETTVTLDRATMQRAAIAAAPLAALSRRAEERGVAVVLRLEELTQARSGYVAAKAQLEKAQALLAASQGEYRRLKTLNADDRNVSDKELQGAEAAFRSDEATRRAAAAAMRMQEETLRQRFGGTIVAWVARDAPVFERLARQEELLLQVSLPRQGETAPPARTIRVSAGERQVPARFVSPAPAVDPRVQGASFFYRVPAQAGLLPGMNLAARIPVGAPRKGVLIPVSAVVWWQGKAWAYLQREEGRFTRREVATTAPVPGGYFVAEGFAPADRVVVRGAQLLLSEELRPESTGGEGEDAP